jgi:hypothetical protein
MLSMMVGPEQDGNRSDYRWLVDATIQSEVMPNINVAGEALLGWEPGSGISEDFDVDPRPGGTFLRGLRINGDNPLWFGLAGYLSSRIDEQGMFTLNTRLEYFNDNAGGRLIFSEVYSASIGLSIVPFVQDKVGKNLMIRPEFRYDFADDKIFDGGTQNNQITFAIDAIFKF